MRRTAFPSFLTWKYSRLEVRLRHYAAGLRCIRLYRISALWVVVFLGYRIGRSARLRRRSGCGRCCWCGGSVGERRGGWSIWSLRSGRLSMLDEADLARDDLRRALDKYDGERGLYRFIQLMWGIVEPETPFVGGWALEGWCEHLEAVTRGDITRLLGNVPPGYSKSLATACFWPAWEWGPMGRPSLRYLCAAYGSHLTTRDNRRFRSIVTHPAYQELWGDRFSLIGEAVELIINDRTGWKLASSVGGVGTGERADRIIIDDPNNPLEAESESVMVSTTTWFREVMPDRLNSLKRSAIVVIQQRTSDIDVSGTILELGLDYVHYSVPNSYDPLRHCETRIGWRDPRGLGADGELLPAITVDARGNAMVEPGSPLAAREGWLAWPERFGAEELAELEKAKGPYAWSSQYQMLPVPRGGGIIKREWWRLWEEPEFPPYGTCVGSLDTAFKENQEADYSAMTVWGAFRHPETDRPALMLRDGWRVRANLHDLVQRVARSVRLHKIDTLLIEDSARGGDMRDEFYRLIGRRDARVVLVKTPGDKVARLNAAVPIFTNGIVYAPEKDWSEMVIDEVARFPRGKHDDLVDTVSQALIYLRLTGVAVRREEHEEALYARRLFKKRKVAIYDV